MKPSVDPDTAIEQVSLLSALSHERPREIRTSRARPTPFGEYTLQRSIGGGGFGEVFLATHDSTWKPVAIKVLREDRHLDSKAVERFEQEIRIGRQLQHPNILPVIADGRAKGLRYFVCPYIEGQDLLHTIGKNPLPVPVAVCILRAVCRAVATAHREGYLHRDLKPANILIEAVTDKPYVADFGLAKQLKSTAMGTATQAVLGTQPYMPPEQADPNLGQISRSTDVYALGVTLYQCLTGMPPFPRSDRPGRDITLQIARDRALPPSHVNAHVPAELDRLCLICLEKSPFDRYKTVDELATDLDLFARGEPIRGRLPSSSTRAYRTLQRHPRLTLAIILLALVGTGSSLSALHYADRADSRGVQLVKAHEDTLLARQREQDAKDKQEEADAAKAAAQTSERVQTYVADMREVPILWESNNISRIRTILDKYNAPQNQPLRNIEWYYWLSTVGSHPRFMNSTIPIEALELSGDGKNMAIIGSDIVIVSAVKTGTELLRANLYPDSVHEASDASPVARAVAFDSSGQSVATCCRIKNGQSFLRLWDLDTGAVRWTVEGNFSGNALAFSPDNTAVVAIDFSGGWTSWSTDTGTRQAAGRCERPDPSPWGSRSNVLRFIGSSLLVASGDGTDIWHWPPDGDTVETGEHHYMSGFPAIVRGRLCLTSFGSVYPLIKSDYLNMPPPESTFVSPLSVTTFIEGENRVVAWCREGMDATEDQTLRTWVLDQDRCPSSLSRELLSPPQDWRRLAVSGVTVAAFGDQSIALWDLPPIEDAPISAVNPMSAGYHDIASPSGRILAVHDFRNQQLTFTSTDDGSVVSDIPIGIGTVLACSFSDDDRYAVLRINNSVSALPIPRRDRHRRPRLEIWDVNNARLIYSMPLVNPGTGSDAIDVARDAAYLTLGDNKLYTVSLTTGIVSNIELPFRALSVASSPVGPRLAIGGDQSGVYDCERHQWIWLNPISSKNVAYHRAEKYVVIHTWQDSRRILAFNAQTGEEWPTLFSEDDGGRLAFSPDSTRVYSLLGDRLRLYSLDENPGTLLLEAHGIAIPENADVYGSFVHDLHRQIGGL